MGQALRLDPSLLLKECSWMAMAMSFHNSTHKYCYTGKAIIFMIAFKRRWEKNIWGPYNDRSTTVRSGAGSLISTLKCKIWNYVTWWRILLLLHAALLSCVNSRRRCSQYELLLKALPLQGESHSELQSRLCIGQVIYQLELFFAEVFQNQNCPLGCAHSKRR